MANCTYQFLSSSSRKTCITMLLYCDYPQSLKVKMASKRRNMFYENKKQEMTEIVTTLVIKRHESSGPEKSMYGLLSALYSKKNQVLDLHHYNPIRISGFLLNSWKTKTIKDAELLDQAYIPERHQILGNDLASAHFIVYRGGRVKFIGDNFWISKDNKAKTCDKLPNNYVKDYYLEAIDASGLRLRYEGLANLTNLSQLTELRLRGCPCVDDWFVDRISGEFCSTLEHLDLSDCHQVTENALSCIYRITNLKTLVLENIVKSRSFEYACLLLEDALPQLNIIGVKYMDVTKLSD